MDRSNCSEDIAVARTRVLIVDDSALVRQLLAEILSGDPDIEVVGTASDPYVARDKIKQLSPDVLTLDVEMPRMDGVTFLGNLMALRPMPVVMISSLTQRGAEITLHALEIGAVDVVPKPQNDIARVLTEYSEEIRDKVKAAAQARVRRYERRHDPTRLAPTAKFTADAVLSRTRTAVRLNTTEKLLAIGASTGGTEAIREVLQALPADSPGVVLTQHIPAAFSGPFARRMDSVSALTVQEAEDGQHILGGHAYIAPGDKHLLVVRDGARYVCRLHDGPPVNRHKPSVDVLFRSVAQAAGANAVGALLTGMGEDGAAGLLEMREAGAHTMVQDEATSVVWGMPGAAWKRGAADAQWPLARIAGALLDAAHARRAA